jgi:hypothetical protein
MVKNKLFVHNSIFFFPAPPSLNLSVFQTGSIASNVYPMPKLPLINIQQSASAAAIWGGAPPGIGLLVAVC